MDRYVGGNDDQALFDAMATVWTNNDVAAAKELYAAEPSRTCPQSTRTGRLVQSSDRSVRHAEDSRSHVGHAPVLRLTIHLRFKAYRVPREELVKDELFA